MSPKVKGRIVKRKIRMSMTAGAVAALLATLGGCGEGEANDTARDSSAQSGGDSSAQGRGAEASTPEAIMKSFNLVEYDFSPRTPKELTEQATVVIVGIVRDISPGRLHGESADDPFASRQAAVRVEVTQVAKGDVEAGQDLWLELSVDPVNLQRGVARGMPLALYLDPAPQSIPSDPYITDGSTVPSAEELWRITHPEGLIIQYGETEGTIAPLSGEILPRESVESIVAR